MSAQLEIDEKRHEALRRMARQRRIPLKRLVEKAVDEFMQRSDDEELLESSARVARRSGLREEHAADIVKKWRARSRRAA